MVIQLPPDGQALVEARCRSVIVSLVVGKVARHHQRACTRSDAARLTSKDRFQPRPAFAQIAALEPKIAEGNCKAQRALSVVLHRPRKSPQEIVVLLLKAFQPGRLTAAVHARVRCLGQGDVVAAMAVLDSSALSRLVEAFAAVLPECFEQAEPSETSLSYFRDQDRFVRQPAQDVQGLIGLVP